MAKGKNTEEKIKAKVEKISKEKAEKSEKNDVVESPFKTGINDTTRGIIIGAIVTAIIASLVMLLVLGQHDGKTTKNDNKHLVDEKDYSEAMKEFYKYFNSEEKTIIVWASSQCGFCVAQKPIVEAVAEQYDINYLYMDYLTLGSNAEIDQVMAELELKQGSTPTSVVVQNGKVIDSWVGYAEGKEYVNNLVKAGVLKEGTEYTLEANIESINYNKFKDLLNGSKLSVVILDTPSCVVCYEERRELNELATKHKFKVYRLSSSELTEDEMGQLIDGLGDWGYDDKEYKTDKTVRVPLLLFVKKGKIVRYEVGYSEDTNLTGLLKKVGLID